MTGRELGSYRIVNRIGAGGMGEVWLAEHVALGRRAAVKVLHPQFSTRADIVTRFFNEARAATAISDPGIVQIFDFGQAGDGSAYIVMELLEGEALDARLARLGTLPVSDALRIMRQVATSLGAAHARGIIHRDLKPENIFLVRDVEVASGERAKILDFGIAKLVGTAGPKTQTAAMMGTPTYMSPEQCRGAGEVDQRTDVYSLGCVLFQLVTGRPPFDADGVGEIIAMHLREVAPLASTLAPGIPNAVEDLIARCLAKDPTARFASAVELAAAIARIHPSGAVPQNATVTASVAPHSTPTTLSSGSAAIDVPRTRDARWIAAAAAVAAIGGVATFAIVRTGAAEQADTRLPAPQTAPAEPASPLPPSEAKPIPAAELAPTQPPHVEDPLVITQQSIAAALDAFITWAKAHVGAPCPSTADLRLADDAWGHAMRVTCTEQPVDAQIGIISAGPDGAFGTTDDVLSWRLAHDIAARVRGERWTATPLPKPHRRPRTPTPPGASGEDIPDHR